VLNWPENCKEKRKGGLPRPRLIEEQQHNPPAQLKLPKLRRKMGVLSSNDKKKKNRVWVKDVLSALPVREFIYLAIFLLYL